jgi:hypothetical protein
MSEPPEAPETPEERLARYRALAEQARRDAARAGPGELHELYLALAQRWDVLADDFEKTMKT